ncbi:aminotransferase class III-fold pyridoxal phosphate-dependent enzyme [Endozoicomonas sp. SCSIO W0465]|uniref:aminotransferase class III-fold pyridoxal phosphate-dependent enzyme n=1 Tax=Endozoicomonas sp. SCSIO W0465 TaxID=2918516 RepID=UPI0020758A25|nr:aminotransferase class III-fold pyridoxal phosphate-dependent enzyme [Endozoicomonas sp. SCSIO W0465]USE38559.1 aminotransferase class III-fold pyridoxal phosphate-dependent enzyme [Endozoicomonas sp. SCSIO W0465]
MISIKLHIETGKLFATEYLGIEPDMMAMAKGIAGGFPIAALVGKADIMDAAPVGGLGGTYAGSPLGCVAALEVLKLIDEQDLCKKALDIGEVMTGHLQRLQSIYPVIADIRTLGAMVAIELVDDTGSPMPELTRALVARAKEKGLILLSCGVLGNVIRFLPALTIEHDLLEEGLKVLEQCFKDCVKQ